MLDWSLSGGQDHYFKAIAARTAGGGFTGEKVMERNKKFDTNFFAPAPGRLRDEGNMEVSAS